METNEDTGDERGYWYDNTAATTAILHALRRFRRADQEMRRRMSADMDMNVSDMTAILARMCDAIYEGDFQACMSTST